VRVTRPAFASGMLGAGALLICTAHLDLHPLGLTLGHNLFTIAYYLYHTQIPHQRALPTVNPMLEFQHTSALLLRNSLSTSWSLKTPSAKTLS
jgi:hypothetical protein